MNYSSIEVVDSKKFEGVKIHVRRVSHGRKLALQSKLAPLVDALTKAQAALEKVRFENGIFEEMSREEAVEIFKKLPEAEQQKIESAFLSLSQADGKVSDVYFDIGFIRTENFNLDGNDNPTGSQLRDEGDPDLYEEAMSAARNQFTLSQKRRADFESLSTSGAAEDGKANPMIAEAAAETGSISKETASSTTQS